MVAVTAVPPAAAQESAIPVGAIRENSSRPAEAANPPEATITPEPATPVDDHRDRDPASLSAAYFKDYVLMEQFQHSLQMQSEQILFNPVTDDVYLYLRQGERTILRWSVDGKVDTLGSLGQPELEGDRMLYGQVMEDGRRIWFWEHGLGRIFEYDIGTGVNTLISETILTQFMSGHASLVTPDGILWAVGGYGYWEFKNLLLTFGRTSYRGWHHEKPEGEGPAKGMGGHMWYLPQSRELLYLVPELDEIPTPALNDTWRLYSYSIDRNAWRHLKRIRTTRLIAAGNYGRRYHSTDGRYFHIVDQFMLDLQRLEILSMETRELVSLDREMMFYSDRLGRWVVAGHDNTTQLANVRVAALDPAGLRYVSVTRADLLSSPFLIGLIITLSLIAGSGMTLGYLLVRRRRSRELPTVEGSNNPDLKILVSGDEVVLVHSDGRKDLQMDPNMKRLWILIHGLGTEGRFEILLSELDQHVFRNSQSIPQNTRLRKKLFDMLEEQVGRSLVTIDKSGIDNRYKVIRFDLKGIEFQSE